METVKSLPPQALPRIIPAQDVVPSMLKAIERQEAVINHVKKSVHGSNACFDTVLRPIMEIENHTQGQIAVIAMLRYAAVDAAARRASEDAMMLLREFESKTTASKELFSLVQMVKDKKEHLHYEEQKYLESSLRGFTKCGHGRLSQEQIELYLERRNHIDDLRRQYNRNIRNNEEGLWLSLGELEGVPALDIERFSQGPRDPDLENLRFVRFTRADLNAVLQYADKEQTRKKLYVANEKKLSQNVPLFKQIMMTRDENARLLGYASHAAFRLEARLAKSTQWVNNFLDNLEQVLLPQGKREMQVLLERRRVDVPETLDSMPPWDYDYYKRLVEEDVQVNHGEIAEYFPLDFALTAMLGIFGSCLQLRFCPVDQLQPDSTWSDDVQVWSVWDDREASKNEFIGYLYADLLSRPSKHQGSQNVNLQCSYLNADGTRVYPATILMCSFPRPTTSGCALLKHSEIISLFHELGHGMHDLVSRTRCARFHGHRTPPDFFEIPSAMLERWCWMKDELKQMSCHYTKLNPEYLSEWRLQNPSRADPPERIPDDLLDALIRSRGQTRALWFQRQLAFARFDMAVHDLSSPEVGINMDPGTVFNECMERLRLLHNPAQDDKGHPQADFHHLVSGMDAGYYSYLCAAVFAADIYHNTFGENPRNQEAWERYRHGILEPGGSKDEMAMVEEYLGHRPSAEYLYRDITQGA